MHRDRSLTVIAPNLDRDLATARGANAARWPELARMAGRGDVGIRSEYEDPAAVVLSALELASTSYPQAPVMAAGAGLDPRGYWLCATPMHFVAGLNDVRAVALDDDQRMRDEEAMQLAVSLAGVLEGEGLTMHRDGQGSWLLQSTRAFDASMASPPAAARSLNAAMPGGRDASFLKRLMTEMQMVLHEHPVNVARARRNQLAINAVWLHGGGVVAAPAPRALPAAFGDDPFLRGVYALHGAAAPAPACDPAQLVQGAASGALALIDIRTLDELESRWLAPLLAALGSHALTSLEIFLGVWRLHIERGDLLKFWRGARAPAQWPA